MQKWKFYISFFFFIGFRLSTWTRGMFSKSDEALASAPWLPGTVWFFPRRIPRWIVHFWNVPHPHVFHKRNLTSYKNYVNDYVKWIFLFTDTSLWSLMHSIHKCSRKNEGLKSWSVNVILKGKRMVVTTYDVYS